MKSNAAQNVIEVYGLIRLALGVAELTGLFFAYFLTEFILSYPVKVSVNLISEGMIAGLFVVVFLRAVFHVVSGIGLALRQSWVNGVFFFFWPLILLATFLLTASFARLWIEEGVVGSFSEAFSASAVLMYLAWAAVDCFVVSGFVTSSQQQTVSDAKMGLGKVAVIALITLLVMGAALFQNKGSAKGFYKGYYKANGKMKTEKILKPAVKKGDSVSEMSKIPSAPTNPAVPKLEEEKVLIEQPVQAAEQAVLLPNEPAAQQVVAPSEEKKEVKGGKLEFSLEIIGGILLILGLILQIGFLTQLAEGLNLSYLGFILISGGFGFWAGFGYLKHMPAFAMICLVCAVLSFALVGILMKNSRES